MAEFKVDPGATGYTDEQLRDKWWRLNHLYKITNEDGETVQFRCNWAQVKLFREMWYKNVILKARQLGFSTLIDLWILDECLFHPGLEAGIVADTRGHAEEIFRRKIKFPYENLPVSIGGHIMPEEGTKGSAGQLRLNHGSVLSVGTSMRSGTVQLLHISEFGKLAARFPDKAEEVVTGSLQAAKSKKAVVWIESTAEGHGGYFFEYCDTARNISKEIAAGTYELTLMDYKFFFFAWWMEPTYMLHGPALQLSEADHEYFRVKLPAAVKDELGMDLELTDDQIRWYLAKRRELKDKIRREFPGTPDEAFEQSVEGAYFGKQMAQLRAEGHITQVPYKPGKAVDTWWDIGVNDRTCIWFTQDVGREVHIIDYYESEGEGLEHYKGVLEGKSDYRYCRHVGPHDLAAREFGTGKSRVETALALGIRFELVPRVGEKADAIEAARNILPICYFDKVRCEKGLEHLDKYRKKWDDHNAVFLSHPVHDKHSNGADAFQSFAMGHNFAGGFYQRAGRGARPVVVARKKWGGAT